MAGFFNGSLCNIFVKNSFKRTLHKQNHYDVLKLSQNCNHAEIKRAYYELSKKYHPDKNRTVSPSKFIDVAEAYKVLSKPCSRHRYDLSLLSPNERYRTNHYEQFTRRNRMDEPVFYRRRTSNYEYDTLRPRRNTRYHDKFTNCIFFVTLLLCMAIGLTLQMLTFKHAMRIRREELRLSTALANRSLEKTKTIVDEPGNKAQIKLLEERFKANNISLD